MDRNKATTGRGGRDLAKCSEDVCLLRPQPAPPRSKSATDCNAVRGAQSSTEADSQLTGQHDNDRAKRLERVAVALQLMPREDCGYRPVNGSVKTSSREEDAIAVMQREFGNRRKIVVGDLPPGLTKEKLKEFLKDYSCKIVSKITDGTVRLLFPSMHQAKAALARLNSTRVNAHKLTSCFGHPDSLLFVGNLPPSYSSRDLSHLFVPFGEILRCFVVCSLKSKTSKGYGFVEFATRDEAVRAKQQTATKVVGQRSLRVDFADNGIQTFEDLHSKTLFVDRLPKDFTDSAALRKLFSNYGTVNFCQIAVVPSGTSRGFAFVDMSSADGAEAAQVRCNGAHFSGMELRVAFGMPCRPGACILQHKPARPTGSLLLGKSAGDCSIQSSVSHSLAKENLPLVNPNAFTALAQLMTRLKRPPLSHPHPALPDPSLTKLPASGVLASLPYAPPPTTVPTLYPLQPPPLTDDLRAESTSESRSPLGRKRLASDRDSKSTSVYDRPFIGQHQQGIPYTHPLKRIRMEDS